MEKIRELERCELPEPVRSVDGRIRWFVVTGQTPLGPGVYCRAIERLKKDGIIRKGYLKISDDSAVDGVALLKEKVVILKDGSWDDPSYFMIVLHETAHLFEKNPPVTKARLKALRAVSNKLENIGFLKDDIERIFDVLWNIYGDYHAGAKVAEWAASDPVTKRMLMEDFRGRMGRVHTKISDDTPLKATIKAALELIVARVEFVHASLVKFDGSFKMFNREDTYRDPGTFMATFSAWLEVAAKRYRVRFIGKPTKRATRAKSNR